MRYNGPNPSNRLLLECTQKCGEIENSRNCANIFPVTGMCANWKWTQICCQYYPSIRKLEGKPNSVTMFQWNEGNECRSIADIYEKFFQSMVSFPHTLGHTASVHMKIEIVSRRRWTAYESVAAWFSNDTHAFEE